MKPRILAIRKNMLEKNDFLARKLRSDFSKNRLFVVNIVSSPGSGKTELLVKLIKSLSRHKIKAGAIVGDLATDNDARRIKATGARTVQINTDGNCHLDAEMINRSLKKLNYKNLDFLFIENVGNLVCPAGYDLGENIRIVLMSVTEGEDKPSKYPVMFNSSDLCVISKTDLSEVCNFKKKLAEENILNVAPDIKILSISARKGHGLNQLIDCLISLKKQQELK